MRTVDIDTYVRAREMFEPCQPDSLALFGRVDKLLAKLCPVIIGLAILYLAAQLTRALMLGWLP